MYFQKTGLYDSKNEKDSCGIGFVSHVKGQKSYDIINKALEVLVNMSHRGAEGADNKTGDGAGILMQMPNDFFDSLGIEGLPSLGHYGSGIIFLPQDEQERQICKNIFLETIKEMGLLCLGFRKVPTDNSKIGNIAKKSEPFIEQVFIKQSQKNTTADWYDFDLEKKLYIVRKLTEKRVKQSKIEQKTFFYICSLSTRTFLYKGMLQPDQLKPYYLDLQNTKLKSALALVHSRFSTNTFPSWDLAQPFRFIAHNGEINTIKGNRFWMQAREANFKSSVFGDDINLTLPVIEEGKSDSASFDNGLEALVMHGRTLPHALTMMIPESWNDKNPISKELKMFYEYHASFMEPWDGPAAIIFTDGRYIGGSLDRNGLRPSRYIITKDDLVVMASEVGVQEFEAENIAYKGRLRPGKILLIDTLAGKIIPDEAVKAELLSQNNYQKWVEENRIDIDDLELYGEIPKNIVDNDLRKFQLNFGLNVEDLEKIILPMMKDGQEATGSMGTDTPLAVLSDQPQKIFNYFKQLFAQVTNPAIDPIREELVMSLTSYMGTQANLLEESPSHCKMLKFKNPVLTNKELVKIKNIKRDCFSSAELSMLFPAKNDNGNSLKIALDDLCKKAEELVDSGINLLIFSDKSIDQNNSAIPSLLAISAVHHHLINVKKRTNTGLILETGDAIEVMHFALLIGYGADAINPYLAFSSIEDILKDKFLKEKYTMTNLDYQKAENNYIKAIYKGLQKVLSKMGISTIRSYRSAQIFEAIGLSKDLIENYFTGTDSRIGGIGFKELEQDVLALHKIAFTKAKSDLEKAFYIALPSKGIYSYRKDGEKHAWNPETISLLQLASKKNDYDKYKQFAKLVDEQNKSPHVLRGLLDWKSDRKAMDISEVEPVTEILKRFATGAMSYGSISKEAHEAMALAMNIIGAKSNTGEGGEDPQRFRVLADGTSKRSAIKQVASGRFGVTANYLVNADEIQIKIAQGAKPGEGGQLPGHKVDEIIAKTRHSTPGVTLISPPPHHDIYSIEDLAQLIFDLKNINPQARISVKLVSEVGVGTIAAGVAKAYADMILISGYDGGTGASPLSSIKHAGLPWELGLSETQQTLVLNKLRSRVRLQTDGQFKTARDVIIAAILGAEEFGFSTSALIVLGCVMMRKCHLNTCPVGIATQDEELRKKFIGKAEYLVNYFNFIAREIREYLALLGFKSFDDLVGRVDLLEQRKDSKKIKANTLLLENIFNYDNKNQDLKSKIKQKDITKDILDKTLIAKTKKAIESKEQITLDMDIKNINRTTGAMLSYEITKLYSEEGLKEDTININFKGSAGQSFGAFLPKGVSFRLIGDANDYLGKGLSGGKIIVVPPKNSSFVAEENIIVGNTLLYGATSGEVYIRGIAGERFCVRNSGAMAVVEGVGDHACEYMTGGVVVILGSVGRNMAAGMSGGIAFVLDLENNFDYFCNQSMVELNKLEYEADKLMLKNLIERHFKYTKSEIAEKILSNWQMYLTKFVKVMPLEYKRVLAERKLKSIENKLENIIEDEQLKDQSDG